MNLKLLKLNPYEIYRHQEWTNKILMDFACYKHLMKIMTLFLLLLLLMRRLLNWIAKWMVITPDIGAIKLHISYSELTWLLQSLSAFVLIILIQQFLGIHFILFPASVYHIIPSAIFSLLHSCSFYFSLWWLLSSYYLIFLFFQFCLF